MADRGSQRNTPLCLISRQRPTASIQRDHDIDPARAAVTLDVSTIEALQVRAQQ